MEVMKNTLSPFSPKVLERSASSCLLHIRDLIKEEGGGAEPESNLGQLEYRCHRRMQKIGVSTLDSYFEILTTLPSGQAELGKLLQEVKGGQAFLRTFPNSTNFAASYSPKSSRARKKTRWRTSESGV
jgi:hypothetical protein